MMAFFSYFGTLIFAIILILTFYFSFLKIKLI